MPRDCVMAAPLPPVSCVCAATRWSGGGVYRVGQLLHKDPKSKEDVNLFDKEQSWRERKGGLRVKVETITFSFVQVFLCVHVC